MNREEELKNLYAVITYAWKVLKEHDYRNMSGEEWEKLIADTGDKYEGLLVEDKIMGRLFIQIMFLIYDYLSPKAREGWLRDAKNDL